MNEQKVKFIIEQLRDDATQSSMHKDKMLVSKKILSELLEIEQIEKDEKYFESVLAVGERKQNRVRFDTREKAVMYLQECFGAWINGLPINQRIEGWVVDYEGDIMYYINGGLTEGKLAE